MLTRYLLSRSLPLFSSRFLSRSLPSFPSRLFSSNSNDSKSNNSPAQSSTASSSAAVSASSSSVSSGSSVSSSSSRDLASEEDDEEVKQFIADLELEDDDGEEIDLDNVSEDSIVDDGPDEPDSADVSDAEFEREVIGEAEWRKKVKQLKQARANAVEKDLEQIAKWSQSALHPGNPEMKKLVSDLESLPLKDRLQKVLEVVKAREEEGVRDTYLMHQLFVKPEVEKEKKSMEFMSFLQRAVKKEPHPKVGDKMFEWTWTEEMKQKPPMNPPKYEMPKDEETVPYNPELVPSPKELATRARLQQSDFKLARLAYERRLSHARQQYYEQARLAVIARKNAIWDLWNRQKEQRVKNMQKKVQEKAVRAAERRKFDIEEDKRRQGRQAIWRANRHVMEQIRKTEQVEQVKYLLKEIEQEWIQSEEDVKEDIFLVQRETLSPDLVGFWPSLPEFYKSIKSKEDAEAEEGEAAAEGAADSEDPLADVNAEGAEAKEEKPSNLAGQLSLSVTENELFDDHDPLAQFSALQSESTENPQRQQQLLMQQRRDEVLEKMKQRNAALNKINRRQAEM